MFPIKVAQRAFLQLKTADGVGMVAEGFALLDILMTRLARACWIPPHSGVQATELKPNGCIDYLFIPISNGFSGAFDGALGIHQKYFLCIF
jgi:hypothetical protein